MRQGRSYDKTESTPRWEQTRVQTPLPGSDTNSFTHYVCFYHFVYFVDFHLQFVQTDLQEYAWMRLWLDGQDNQYQLWQSNICTNNVLLCFVHRPKQINNEWNMGIYSWYGFCIPFNGQEMDKNKKRQPVIHVAYKFCILTYNIKIITQWTKMNEQYNIYVHSIHSDWDTGLIIFVSMKICL